MHTDKGVIPRAKEGDNAHHYQRPRISFEVGAGPERAATLARDNPRQAPHCRTDHLQGRGKGGEGRAQKENGMRSWEGYDMDDNIKIESELLLARLRDRQQRRQDDLEALLAQVDLFKALDSPRDHASS